MIEHAKNRKFCPACHLLNFYAVGVVYFDQLLGAVRTLKLVKTLFQLFSTKTLFFQMFFLDFRRKFIEKGFKRRKKVENSCKKYFDQLSRSRSNRKLVIIHNKWTSQHWNHLKTELLKYRHFVQWFKNRPSKIWTKRLRFQMIF